MWAFAKKKKIYIYKSGYISFWRNVFYKARKNCVLQLDIVAS